MQNLDIISVNLWQIVISLCNLLLLFLLLKKFLYKPVMRIMKERKELLEGEYAKAEKAVSEAEKDRRGWEEKMQGAREEAQRVVNDATRDADRRGEEIVGEAKLRAASIIREAENQAELEHKKAQEGIKQEIVSVSAALAEKMLEREVSPDDHRALIDSVIAQIGEENDSDQ